MTGDNDHPPSIITVKPEPMDDDDRGNNLVIDENYSIKNHHSSSSSNSSYDTRNAYVDNARMNNSNNYQRGSMPHNRNSADGDDDDDDSNFSNSDAYTSDSRSGFAAWPHPFATAAAAGGQHHHHHQPQGFDFHPASSSSHLKVPHHHHHHHRSSGGHSPSHLRRPNEGARDAINVPGYGSGPAMDPSSSDRRSSMTSDSDIGFHPRTKSMTGSNGGGSAQSRAKREFVPDHKKDDQYWNKRHKNNESARQSRLKRKMAEEEMTDKMMKLQEENIKLGFELRALKARFNVDDKEMLEIMNTAPGSPHSSQSSGIGASQSSGSLGGGSEHSTSSSPVLGHSDNNGRSADEQKANQAHSETEFYLDSARDRAAEILVEADRRSKVVVVVEDEVSKERDSLHLPPPPPTSSHSLHPLSQPMRQSLSPYDAPQALRHSRSYDAPQPLRQPRSPYDSLPALRQSLSPHDVAHHQSASQYDERQQPASPYLHPAQAMASWFNENMRQTAPEDEERLKRFSPPEAHKAGTNPLALLAATQARYQALPILSTPLPPAAHSRLTASPSEAAFLAAAAGKSSVYWPDFPVGMYSNGAGKLPGESPRNSGPAPPRSEQSSGSSGGSPCSIDPASSPSIPGTSEDDVSSGRVTSRGSSTSSGGMDEESLHRMPPKFRLKRDLISFAANSPGGSSTGSSSSLAGSVKA